MQVRKANSELEMCKGSFFHFVRRYSSAPHFSKLLCEIIVYKLIYVHKKVFLITVISHQSFEGYDKYLPKKAPFIYGNNQDVVS